MGWRDRRGDRRLLKEGGSRSGSTIGFIRPDLRALVSWQDRAYRKLTATLSLRSLDDGTERRIAVDAGAGVK